MRRTGILGYLAAAMLVAASSICISGCSSNPEPAQATGKIVVMAAASLKSAFTKIGQQFKTDNPGSSIDFEFAGSSELATQLTQGATADVFASADTAQMDVVAKAGLLAGDPTKFASNSLVIVTAPGNPKKVGSFADLTKPGLNVVICQKPVPCGSATQRIEDSTGVRLNPVSEEPSVTDVLNKVTGRRRAGIRHRRAQRREQGDAHQLSRGPQCGEHLPDRGAEEGSATDVGAKVRHLGNH